MRAVNFCIFGSERLDCADLYTVLMGNDSSRKLEIVKRLNGNSKDCIVLWNHACVNPELVASIVPESFTPCGGTYPSEIIRQAAVVEEVWASDHWILCTDGEVDQGEVSKLTQLAESENVLQIPVIVVIVKEADQPSQRTDLSVGVSFYACAKEAAIL